MKKSFFNFRIPTLLGIVLIIITLASTTYLANQGIITIGRASANQTPEDIRITNVFSNSFTVSYKTQASALGTLNLGKDKNLNQIVIDDRDKESPKPHKLHYFTVKNLSPSSNYFFSVISNDNIYTNNNSPFTQTTSLEQGLSQANIISGKIITQEGASPEEAIVYIKKTSDFQSISALVDNGIFSIDRSLLGINSGENQTLQMFFLSDKDKSSVVIKSSDTHPVPVITLSKDYDFTQDTRQPVSSTSAIFQTFPSNFTSKSATPEIISPKNEETFKDTKPQFFGTASEGATVKITIHSDEIIQNQVKADSYGKWSYRPSQPLSPGKHTITITTQDQSGITKNIEKTFIVFASGSQFVEPSVSPSNIPSPTTTSRPTQQPTLTPSPSPTLIPPTPTIILPSPTHMPISGTINLPTPGNSAAIITTLKGIGITIAGLILLFLTRGFLQI